MARHYAWGDYFWPHTTVFANKLGIVDAEELREVEHELTADRQEQIERGEVVIARTFDNAHLCAVHAHLFGEVYDWGGQWRTIPAWAAGPGAAASTSGRKRRAIGGQSAGVHQWRGLGAAECGESVETAPRAAGRVVGLPAALKPAGFLEPGHDRVQRPGSQSGSVRYGEAVVLTRGVVKENVEDPHELLGDAEVG